MDEKKFQHLLQRIEELKKGKGFDLSMEEDLSIGIMNLVSLEEHFFFTASKTGKEEYLDLMRDVRETRKTLMSRMVARHEGETWCVVKHLLAATMRLIEVGTKLQAEGKAKEAKETFTFAYKLYSLFWAVRLKLVALSELKKGASPFHEMQEKGKWSLEEIVSKLVDCCEE